MLYFNLSLTSSFEKIKISTKDGFDESFSFLINIINDHWTLAISHFLLSFPRSTLGPQQSSIVCIGLTADMGFCGGEGICFGQLQILFLVSEPASRNPKKMGRNPKKIWKKSKKNQEEIPKISGRNPKQIR